jgi:RNA polymerase sigma-70 factor (ECF subfamily)
VLGVDDRTEPEAERRRFEAERRDPELVFRRYYAQLFRYCRVRSRSDEDAEDLVAQVFAEVLRALPRLRWQGRPVLAFLYTVAGRRLADRARRRRGDDVPLDALPDVPGGGPTADDLLTGPLLQRAILELPEDQRLAVYLQVVNGLSFAEVATVVGRTEKACKGLVYRGLERLRERLEAEGVTP